MLKISFSVPTLADAKNVVTVMRAKHKARKMAKAQAFQALVAEHVLAELKANEQLNAAETNTTEGEAS